MGELISLKEYKEKKEIAKRRKEQYDKLNDDLKRKREQTEKLIKRQARRPYNAQLETIKSLQNRHNYDKYFIDLLDLFMERFYPDYKWKFSIFLDEMDK